MSKQYWDDRYESGVGAGHDSRGQLLEMKQRVIQGVIGEYAGKLLIDLGCGDGTLSALLKVDSYLGLDISEKAIAIAMAREVPNRHLFYVYQDSNYDAKGDTGRGNMAMSVDVLQYLTGEEKENHLKQLFELSERVVLIYAPDRDGAGLALADHMHFAKFTPYIKKHFKEWKLAKKIKNEFPATEPGPFVSFADFFIYERNDEK